MNAIRFGCVRYLNATPLIEGLEKLDGATLELAAPSALAGLLGSGRVDVALVSLIDAARAATPFVLLPVGMIGCDGPTMTVRLFSAVPFERAACLHCDTDSHTSVVLAQIILARKFGVRPPVAGFDARERVPERGGPSGRDLEDSWPETVLLIGDKVVTDAPPAERYPHQLDLGQAWKDITGLPFVYAAWMCRAGEEDTPTIVAAMKILDRQLRHNTGRIDWLVEKHAPRHGWPPETARRYIGECLRYRVGPREHEAAARFIAEAAELGLVEARELHWAILAETAPA